MVATPQSAPRLARGVKLRHDETRDRWVLLVPERVLAPDDIAVEILHLCDGQRTIAQMADTLAEKYAAPADQIASDVIEMIQDLANSGFLIDGGGKP
ncbi:pyrroloquinoline quinone biosynthesis peptide chaperone PqqD [uncultured Pelagibacterium sp.]|uniref:pyrroloquinoline quinone biosynthesis peptide chaperone PqqD n=1 Tax=uncultured Pelagibacterium sp. TaxID=1159875 RepID=UPI0030D9B328